ncbi:MAG: hypothetical protein PHR87_03765 [Sulfurospirillaceae bacterium]|nr:hypothetical protein [Sulfurospirillaceae bacterium]
MHKNSISFSQLINIALGFIIVVGSYISYRYGNFGGVSLNELKMSYINKNDVKFRDLPANIQTNFIDKNAIIEQSKDASLFEDVYLDEQGNPIPEADITQRDLKRMVQKLQKTLLFLQHDNMLMSNEKNDLLKRIDELKSEHEEEKNTLANKNLEKINEAEQQHYKNISDLTMKINDLQKENVVISQRANIESNTLKNQIEELKAQMNDEQEKKRDAIKKAREEEQFKLVDYKDKIKLLTDQIALLNDQIKTNNESSNSALSRKIDEIAKLKDDITQASNDKNAILTKNAQSMVELERKHGEEIAKYTKTIELLKADTEKLIAANRADLAKMDEENTQKILQEQEKTKAANSELASAKKHIDALMLENEKDFNKFRTYLEDEKKLNKELNIANKQLEAMVDATEQKLNGVILSLNETVAKKEANIKDLSQQIAILESQKLNFDAEVKKKIEENDRIHNKNYKIFNEKIAGFEASKREMISKLDKQLSEYKNATKENYDKMQFHINELTRGNTDLKQKIDAKEKEVQTLNAQLLALNAAHEKAKIAQEEKLSDVRSAFNALQADVKQKDIENLGKINTFEKELKAKEMALAAFKKEETLKIASFDKESRDKELQLTTVKDELGRKEEAIKILTTKIKTLETNQTMQTNKQIEELKAKLALFEKNRIAEDSKMVDLKDELKRKEIEYLDNLKMLEKEIKAKDTKLLAVKEHLEKNDQLKLTQEEKLKAAKEEFKQRELNYLDTIKALDKEIKNKETALANAEKSGSNEVVTLQKELKAKDNLLLKTKDELTKHLASSEQMIKTLNEKIKFLETATPKVVAQASSSTTTPVKSHKLVLIEKIHCTDMGTGVNAITTACQQNVKTFLAKYDTSYYFEVAPIVDNGGFASLKLIKSKKIGVEDSEIDRITGLANIGLGKARAKAGGELVEKVLGEGTKISYALSNIELDHARGFQISVYK